QIVPSIYEFLSTVEHKIIYFEECCRKPLTSILWKEKCKMLWKSIATADCLVTNIVENILFLPYWDFFYCSIETYRQYHKLQNVKPSIYLDVSQSWENWGGIQPESCDLIVNINMMHISPLACTTGLFNGVGKILKPQGLLLTYGICRIGSITPQSNVDFDQKWGLREVSFLKTLGQEEEIVDMPANKKCLLFHKDSVV
uniref:Methyltransferase-like 26 n=1 Tax=Sinocyclocheilus grahami TaxID=75366 RepID=A0A672P8R0_SINGR